MRRLTASLSRATSSPSTVPAPSLGASTPHSMRMSVDLPLPFGPSRPKIVPRGTRSETPSTAVRAPKRRVSARATRAGGSVGARASVLTPRTTLSFPEPNVRRHARAQELLALLERHAHAHHDLRAFLGRLHVVGRE